MQNEALHPAEKIALMNALLKQVALTTYGRMEVAALQQQAWLDFLHQKASYINQPDCLADCLQKAYAGPVGADIEHFQIENCARYFAKWIKGHHQ
nr:DUF4381 domain-containing protein [Thiomicrorhabdus sp.]